METNRQFCRLLLLHWPSGPATVARVCPGLLPSSATPQIKATPPPRRHRPPPLPSRLVTRHPPLRPTIFQNTVTFLATTYPFSAGVCSPLSPISSSSSSPFVRSSPQRKQQATAVLLSFLRCRGVVHGCPRRLDFRPTVVFGTYTQSTAATIRVFPFLFFAKKYKY